MLKILSVSPSYYPANEFGGPVTALKSLNKYLNLTKSKVNVLTTAHEIPSLKNKYKKTKVDNVVVEYFPVIKFFNFLSPTGWHFSPKLFTSLLRKSKNTDVIYCRSLWNFPTIACYIASLLNNKPLIIAATGKLTPWAFSHKSLKKNIAWNLLFKNIVKHSYVHYVSEQEKHISQKNINIFNNGIIIPTGTEKINLENRQIDNALRFNKKNTVTKKIFFLGRIHEIKGIDLLIEIFNDLVNKHKDTSLILSGPYEGSHHIELKKKLKTLGLSYIEASPDKLFKYDISSRVVFTGMVSGKIKNWLFENTDLYAQLSHSEGFSNSIIEALAFSKPILISEGCNFNNHELKNFGKIHSEISNSAEFINDLFSDDSKLQKYSHESFRYAYNKYNWQTIAKKAVSEFKNIKLSEKKK